MKNKERKEGEKKGVCILYIIRIYISHTDDPFPHPVRCARMPEPGNFKGCRIRVGCVGVWASGLPATRGNANTESLQSDTFRTRR